MMMLSITTSDRVRRGAVRGRLANPVALVLALGAVAPAFAQTFNLDLTSPTLDRWNYPFASSPGGHSYAAIFAPLTDEGFDPQFDNRDGQMAMAFDVAAAGVPTDLQPQRYSIASAALTLTVETSSEFQYDPTPDPYHIWLGAGDPDFMPDADPGHAVELFGSGFRHGYTSATYTENVPYSPLGPFGQSIRSAYPVSIVGGRCVDVSNNVDERFDPVPFAVGTNPALTPGQVVPADTVLHFEINASDADVQRWLRRAVGEGIVHFCVASIFPSQQQQTGTYPRFYTKENLSVLLELVSAATLEMTVEVLAPDAAPPMGDVDGNGSVDVDDLVAVILAWGDCPCCAADVDFNDVVNVDDLVAVILTWG
jgi:hypothetical protein